MKYKDIKNKKDKQFKRTVDIPRILFELFVGILEDSFKEKQRKGDPKQKLDLEDILLMTLTYYRDYPTFFNLGNIFELDESNVYRWIKWTEKTLYKQLEGVINISLLDESNEQLVDVTECTIQRPKDNDIQREYYSGKKKNIRLNLKLL